jgi:cellulose synthase/poly-beta-1,6-N-acetylglucosamine synthase-like glycosyltransferase
MPARRHLGAILVRTGALAPALLNEALAMQRQQDALLGHILVVGGHISPDSLTEALAAQSELRRLDLDRNPPDRSLVAQVDPHRCLALEALPWRRESGRLVVAVANPANSPDALLALAPADEPTDLVIAAPDAIRRAITHHFGARLVREAETRCPEALSCRSMLSAGWTRCKAGILIALAASLTFAPSVLLFAVMAWVLVFTLLTMALRLVAIAARLRPDPTSSRSDAPHLVDIRRLPPVSILVPLKSEAAIAGHLLRALERMDYPAPLLDIKLVLEADDLPTIAALQRAGLPPTMELIVVPKGTLQTKPRALNYALPFCRGEIVGIYDAEDRPDPGQIRAVVHHFQHSAPEVACVQGYLDFYNAERNWLSRCFTIEYAVWFRVVLQGVQRLRLPIPLGGTTLFFRRRVLDEIGAWDAHNVTEDADLGMRLARRGYRCDVIDTVTEEEANSASIPAWIRQRSRWLKGYAITWATHMKNPLALWRDLGPLGFLGFQILFLGGLTSYLAMPLFWLLWAGVIGLRLPVLDHVPAGFVAVVISAMVAGQVVMWAAAGIALAASGRLRLLPWVLTLGPYWQLGAVAAVLALAEIVYAPFLWRKTRHGDDLAELDAAGSQPGA